MQRASSGIEKKGVNGVEGEEGRRIYNETASLDAAAR